ncbi:retropepsin-like domain-containing protein [bacterium]|nr:retropepsin-like domain-containing protein [bacterium]
MRKLRDNYVVRYRRIRGKLHPIVKFGLSCNGRIVTVEAYVDSGTAYSLFSPDDAKRLGINYRSGRLTWVQGVGGTFVPVYLHKLRVVIGRFSFKATVGFSDHIGVGFNLIGRKDIFNRLSFTFNDKYNFLLVSNVDDIPTSVRTHLGLPVR